MGKVETKGRETREKQWDPRKHGKPTGNPWANLWEPWALRLCALSKLSAPMPKAAAKRPQDTASAQGPENLPLSPRPLDRYIYIYMCV